MAGRKLKVGVITMHRVVNYGSVLQAYATQRVLERLGCECDIIDYVFPNAYHFGQGYPSSHLTWKNRTAKMLWLKSYWRKVNRFERFRCQYLHLSRCFDSQHSLAEGRLSYDVYLTGSDQVWNPRHMKGDEIFLLSFAPDNVRKVSYASSFACNSLTEDMERRYVPLLKRYDALSVREENGRDLVRRLIGRDAFVGLDPTLLLEALEWRMLADGHGNPYRRRKYILLYMMGYAFDPVPYIYRLLKHLQCAMGMEIISFSPVPPEAGLREVTVVDDASPVTFIHLFDAAGCVVTSSFHGTAFAVNFGKPLYSLVNEDSSEGDDRQCSLLRSLKLDNCIIRMNTSLDNLPNITETNTASAMSLLENARSISVEYLKKTVGL